MQTNQHPLKLFHYIKYEKKTIFLILKTGIFLKDSDQKKCEMKYCVSSVESPSDKKFDNEDEYLCHYLLSESILKP